MTYEYITLNLLILIQLLLFLRNYIIYARFNCPGQTWFKSHSRDVRVLANKPYTEVAVRTRRQNVYGEWNRLGCRASLAMAGLGFESSLGPWGPMNRIGKVYIVGYVVMIMLTLYFFVSGENCRPPVDDVTLVRYISVK